MNISILKYGFVSLALLLPAGAYAQGVVNGANEGAQQGGNAAGPVGAVVGGAVGAVTGGINGLIGIDMMPRFHRYVVEQHRPSYRVEETVTVGTVLPAEGVEYYEAPAEYGVTQYRYTVVNDEVVLVESLNEGGLAGLDGSDSTAFARQRRISNALDRDRPCFV